MITAVKQLAKPCSAALLLGLLNFAVAPQAQAQTLIKPCKDIESLMTSGEHRFALYHSQFPGQLAITTHDVRVSGRHFKIDSSSTAQGLLALFYSGELVQHSEGLVDDGQGFAPIFYSEKRGKRALKETVVDAESKTILFKERDERADWVRGTQDRLSLIYQMSALLQCQGSSLQEGQVIQVPVMSTSKLEVDEFTVRGLKETELHDNGPAKFKLWVIEQTDKDDKLLKLWFDPARKFLPVQIELKDDEGKVVTQRRLEAPPNSK